MDKKDVVISNVIYPIGKDLDGVVHTTKELHEVLLKLIKEFDRVCRKNDIKYALSFGSALGLYNYGGFIPWDDDADLVIDYFDIPRLIEAFKKDLSDEFTFDCYETNHRYNVLIPAFKMRLKNSYVLEKNHICLPNRCRNGNGYFIDIAVLCGVPEDPKEHKKILRKVKRVMPYYVFLDGFLRIHPYLTKKRLKRFEAEIAEKYKDSNMISQTPIIPFQDWGEAKVNAFPKDVIYPFREYDFEGYKFYSFNNVEEFVRLRYGEKSLRKWDGEKWIDSYPEESKDLRHMVKYSLTRTKKK